MVEYELSHNILSPQRLKLHLQFHVLLRHLAVIGVYCLVKYNNSTNLLHTPLQLQNDLQFQKNQLFYDYMEELVYTTSKFNSVKIDFSILKKYYVGQFREYFKIHVGYVLGLDYTKLEINDGYFCAMGRRLAPLDALQIPGAHNIENAKAALAVLMPIIDQIPDELDFLIIARPVVRDYDMKQIRQNLHHVLRLAKILPEKIEEEIDSEKVSH